MRFMETQAVPTAPGSTRGARPSVSSLIVVTPLRLLLVIALFSAQASAANDPGHDSLYIEQIGDSELSGSLNITQNLSIIGKTTVSGLQLWGDATTPGSGSYISAASGTDWMRIQTPGDLYLQYAGGYSVIVGSQSLVTNLNVTGSIISGGVAVCLANGTNCIGGTNTGNISEIQAGNGISVSDGTGPVATISTNAQTCGGDEYSYWDGDSWGCRADQNSGGTLSGSGSDGYVPKWTSGGTELTDSIFIDYGDGSAEVLGELGVQNMLTIRGGLDTQAQEIKNVVNIITSTDFNFTHFKNPGGHTKFYMDFNNGWFWIGGEEADGTPNQALHVVGSANFSQEGAEVWVDGSRVCTETNGLCAGAVDTVWSITGQYLYNNSGSLDLNETKLNDTVDERIALNPEGFLTSTPYQSTAGGWTNTTTVTSTALDVNVTTGNLTVISGKIGIGIENPTSLLQIAGDGESDRIHIGTTQRMIVGERDPATIVPGSRGITAPGGIVFRASESGSYQMVIMNTSRIGINTSSPNSTLHVVGTGNISGALYANGSRVCTETNGLCAGAVDTVWSITGQYLYNNSGSLDLNETKLNDTVDERIALNPEGFLTSTPYQSTAGGWTNTTTVTSTALDVNVTTGNLTVVGGYIGVGVTSPSAYLDIQSTTTGINSINARYSNNYLTFGSGGLRVKSDNSDSAIFVINGTGGADIAQFYDSTVMALVIKDGGRVGINTTSPNSTLHVMGTANISGALHLPNSACGAGEYLTTSGGAVSCATPTMSESDTLATVLWRGAVASATIDMNSSNLITNIGNGGTDFTTGGGLNLAGTLAVAGTGAHTIAGSLNVASGGLFANGTHVGIGTTAPNATLHVVGDVNITGEGTCLHLPGGGKLCGNSTCSTLYSPDGTTKVEACN